MSSPTRADFLKIGCVYATGRGAKFRIDAIASHPDPDDGEQMVIGWKLIEDYWRPEAYAVDEWLELAARWQYSEESE